jgi:hypothetical protein
MRGRTGAVRLKGASHRDRLAFPAKITAKDGAPGLRNGLLITVVTAYGALDPLQKRIGRLLPDFGDGESRLAARQWSVPALNMKFRPMRPKGAQSLLAPGFTLVHAGRSPRRATLMAATGLCPT